jgi:hypothetical protein
MMTVAGLKEAMKAATEGKTNAADALTVLGNAIATYLKDNAAVTFQWTGTNSVSPYDTQVLTATGKIIALAITLTPSGAESKDPALARLGNEITAGIRAGTYTITEAGYTTSPAAMADAPQLSISIALTGDRDVAYTDFANDIYTQLTGYVPAAPCAGSHGTYAGSGVVTGIA